MLKKYFIRVTKMQIKKIISLDGSCNTNSLTFDEFNLYSKL